MILRTDKFDDRWLVLEPFITPYLFEPHISGPDPAVDEWHLSLRLGDRLADVLEEHYRTFIVCPRAHHVPLSEAEIPFQTEKDFAEIAGAGLNWVRIPIPFWAVEKADDEPYLAHVSWKCKPINSRSSSILADSAKNNAKIF